MISVKTAHSDPLREPLLRCYRAALEAVAGERVTARALEHNHPEGPVRVVAIGKAAAAMYRGAWRVLGDAIEQALVITKRGHLDGLRPSPRLKLMEAGHPWPDEASLAAGEALVEMIERAPEKAPFLFLISGGSSALVERLPPGIDLADLRRANDHLLASGLDIGAMNQVRKRLSALKGGRLAHHLAGRPARVLLISDVPGDDPATIGSGLLVADVPPETELEPELPRWLRDLMARGLPAPLPDDPLFDSISVELVATLDDARRAAAAEGRRLGHAVFEESAVIRGDALVVGAQLASRLLEGEAGLYVWGGETTVTLPPSPGRGGRNQALALAAAIELEGRDDVALLAAGTDGSDGPTEEAGAVVDGATCHRGRAAGLDPERALAGADSGTFLAASGDLLRTGPTGTNVMDLVLAIRR